MYLPSFPWLAFNNQSITHSQNTSSLHNSKQHNSQAQNQNLVKIRGVPPWKSGCRAALLAHCIDQRERMRMQYNKRKNRRDLV